MPFGVKNVREKPIEKEAQYDPDVHQGHADVLAACAQRSETSIAIRAYKRASTEAPVSFHVTNHWLNCITALVPPLLRLGRPFEFPCDPDSAIGDIVPAVAAVDMSLLRRPAGYPFVKCR